MSQKKLFIMDKDLPDLQVLENPIVRKIDREKLVAVNSLKHAFELFGVKSDDRVDTRDMVLMTSIIEKEMKAARKDLLEKKDYDMAARVRDRLKTIHKEFRELQHSNEIIRQGKEEQYFERASRKMRQINGIERNKGMKITEEKCEEKMKDLLRVQDIQRDQLEEHLENLHKPPVRYSKGLLDMMHSERHLAKLNKFEEAKSLRKGILALEPQEVAAHYASIERKYRKRREKLQSRHKFERRKLEEKLYDMKLRAKRCSDNKDAELDRKLNNHHLDMNHKHILESNKTPLFCAVVGGKVRPVTKNRKGYKHTDATFRGTQLLTSVQGDAIKGVPSLCVLHDFDNMDPDSIVYKP